MVRGPPRSTLSDTLVPCRTVFRSGGTTAGQLGQGLATAVGMAIAERHLNVVYGDDLVDHRTYVIAGDECLMECINHVSFGLAGHLQLGRLTLLCDVNKITIRGSTDLSPTENIPASSAAIGSAHG